MVGKQISGRIQKEACDPYEFVVPETAEIVEMNYRWTYVPDEVKTQHHEITFSKNGSLVEA